jgi:transcriptional antiterminator Rof (Rho-off)
LLQVARDLTINGTGLVNMTAGGEIELGGNWTNNRGTDGFQEGIGTVELNGSIQQFIKTVDGQIETFNNLIVNNSLNRDEHDEVVLRSPVNVAGIFTLQDGHVLTTQTNLLTITNPAVGAVVGGSVNSYVNGPMARHTNSTGDYNFPVGKPNGPYTSYRPAIVAPDSNSPTVYNTEYKVQETTPTPLTPRTMLGILNTEYWTINRTGGTADAIVKLGYINPNINDHWDDVEPCWYCNVAIAKTYEAQPPATGPLPPPTWYFTNYTNNNSGFNTSLPEVRFWADNGLIWTKLLNTFGNFTFGYHYPIVLGVQDQLNLISFNAALQGRDALLAWTIEGLSQAQQFELEYSSNGTTFFRLASIRPTNTNSYSYLHKGLAAGKHHYRLLLTDKQGRRYYSAIRTLTVAKQRTVIRDLPYTVVRNEVMVDIETTAAQSVGFKIIASNGVVLSASEGRLNVGFNRQTVPLPPMAEGIYFIQVTVQDGTSRTLKFMKE